MSRPFLPTRWRVTGAAILVALLALVLVLVATTRSAAAGTLYVNFGDSLGAGFGASPGHDYFDRYCAHLKASKVVDRCINEAVGGTTSQTALASGMVQKVVNDIRASTDTPVVTVSLGGNDLLGGSACQPITRTRCPFIHNMRTILNRLERALAARPGSHEIKWLEYYNPDHDNPYGNASLDRAAAELMLGSDVAYTACSSRALDRIGLDDAIHCVAVQKGATPVDLYAPFQSDCTHHDCFADASHPDDKGHRLLFEALRDTSGRPVPAAPPPDRPWPRG